MSASKTEQASDVVARTQADLVATINQSTVDKILGSVRYPFTVFDHSWPFSPSIATNHTYAAAQLTALLEKAIKQGSAISPIPKDPEGEFFSELLSSATEIMEGQKRLLHDETVPIGYRKKLQEAVDSGVLGLAKLAGPIQGHLAWLQIILRQKPSIAIASPETSIKNIKVAASATGELWVEYWWFGWKWARIASITVRGIDVVADAHGDITAGGTKVQATGAFDKLRLDYDILRDLPLEGLANSILGNTPLGVYDASKLVATIPLLESHFAVSSITLPRTNASISVGVTVKQVT